MDPSPGWSDGEVLYLPRGNTADGVYYEFGPHVQTAR